MKRLLIVVMLLWAQVAFGAAVQIDFLLAGMTDTNGEMLSGGLVYTFSAGSTASKTTWIDSAKGTPAANPIVLDAYGRANVYADGNYKLVIKTAEGVTLYTLDNLEYVTALSPTNLTVTNLTVASGTVSSLVSPHGVLSDQTISSASISLSTLVAPTIKAPTVTSFTVQLMASASIDAIASPPTGLVIYNTSSDTLMIYNGSVWKGW